MEEKIKSEEIMEMASTSLTPLPNIIIDYGSKKQKTETKDPLEVIKELVNSMKQKGLEYTLLSSIFVIFFEIGRETIGKKEMEKLILKEINNNKGKIISSPTYRGVLIDERNYKYRAKDIFKANRCFVKIYNRDEEPKIKLDKVMLVKELPRIVSQLKSIQKKGEIAKNLFKKDKNVLINPEVSFDFSKASSECQIYDNEKTDNKRKKKHKKSYKHGDEKNIEILEDSENENKNLSAEDEKDFIEDSNIEKIEFSNEMTLLKKRKHNSTKIKKKNSQKDESSIKKEDKLQSFIILEKKLDYLMKKGEAFLNIINSEETQKEVMKKIDLLSYEIERIKEAKKMMTEYEKDLILTMDSIKNDYKEYKSRIELLEKYRESIDSPKDNIGLEKIKEKYKTTKSECELLTFKIGLSMDNLLKEFSDMEEHIDIIYQQSSKYIISNNIDKIYKREKEKFISKQSKIINDLKEIFQREINRTLINTSIDENGEDITITDKLEDISE